MVWVMMPLPFRRIDLVLKQSRNGIVFIPEGTYRLGKTVHLWSGIT